MNDQKTAVETAADVLELFERYTPVPSAPPEYVAAFWAAKSFLLEVVGRCRNDELA